MVGHGGSSAGSYLANPTSPIPCHCPSIVATSTVRVNYSIGVFKVCLCLFPDKLNPTAFAPVMYDLSGNVKVCTEKITENSSALFHFTFVK